ncbi:MAG: hypothetical protein ACI8XO_001929 [Verrucomicrobiales bacterium]|jgi:hypothetical protein
MTNVTLMNSNESEASAKDKSRGVSTEMSPKAISRRLDIMGELSELAFFLAKGKPVGRVAEDLSTYRATEQDT